MPFSTIATPEAKPVADYKMATRMEGGRLLYISGQVAWDASGAIVGKGDARAQARQVLQNMRAVLQAAGGDLSNLMKITTYITKIEDRPAVAGRSPGNTSPWPRAAARCSRGSFRPAPSSWSRA